VETARILEGSGVVRVAVHGRTKEQGYGGEADWGVIGEVAEAVGIPVVGNGDITNAAVALRRKQETGVRGLMIGRAAMTAPWIFGQIRAALNGMEVPEEPGLAERWERILDHVRQEIEWRGSEDFAVRSMRSRLMAYTRGMPEGRGLREKLSHISSLAGLEETAWHSVQEAAKAL
jgi:tRNA-dihydrouridine synthase B